MYDLKRFIIFNMKKNNYFSVACIAAIALFFFSQKQTTINAFIASNVEALTSDDGDNGEGAILESVDLYGPGTYYVTDEYGNKIPAWTPTLYNVDVKGAKLCDASWWYRFWGHVFNVDPNDYLCAIGDAKILIGTCYEIVVFSNR